MKYIKANPLHNHTRVIVGEMINIMHGSNYFVNGLLQPKLKKTNIYVIKSVEYTVYPNMGIVYLTGSINITLDMIQTAISSMLIEAKVANSISVNLINSTQYISISQDVQPCYSVELCIDTHIFNIMHKDYTNSSFKWFVYSSLDHGTSPLYIPNLTDITSYKEDLKRFIIPLSLSSIIYDSTNVYNIAHNSILCDYPTIDLYSNKASICPDIITISLRSTIDLEIAKHFTKLDKKILYYPIESNIYWLQWDNDVKNVNIKHIVNSDCNYMPNYISNDYRCIITNTKIYDDCYIFDIYQQEITEMIHSKDLPAALAAGAKQQIPIKKQITKKNTTNMVSITRTINYDKPIRFLVSGYAMHYKLYDHGKTNAIGWFQNTTNSKVIVYRTKCPVTRESVIKSFDKSSIYINVLLALNTPAKIISESIITSVYNSRKYTFVRYLSMSDVLLANAKEIYCKFQIYN
jgi:hypothetical protein